MIENKSITMKCSNLLRNFVKHPILFFSGCRKFHKDYRQLKKQLIANDDMAISSFYPILYDSFLEAGTAKGGYFWQDLYVANRISKANPVKPKFPKY